MGPTDVHTLTARPTGDAWIGECSCGHTVTVENGAELLDHWAVHIEDA